MSVDEVDDPRIEEPTDAIIKITATAVCGSALHLYDHGAALLVKPGDIFGHEPMGEVVEVGSAVTHISPGDRVVVPFNISCGSCFMCSRQLSSQCETTAGLSGKKGASLFGYTHMYCGVAGGQAEYLRVPQAHFGPIPVHDGVPELASLLLSDVPPGGTVVIYGLGPIGQMCVTIAKHLGAGRVIGIDWFADRLKMALDHGAEVIDYSAVDDVVEAVKALTDGRGADSAIEAVGMDADGSFAERFLQTLKLQPDRMIALHQTLGSVRRGGTASVVGVYGGWMPSSRSGICSTSRSRSEEGVRRHQGGVASLTPAGNRVTGRLTGRTSRRWPPFAVPLADEGRPAAAIGIDLLDRLHGADRSAPRGSCGRSVAAGQLPRNRVRRVSSTVRGGAPDRRSFRRHRRQRRTGLHNQSVPR
ncbi:MAG: alcohol dehydrogenase catalytic domain-containing protein [Frankiaceae bacterium]